MKSKAFLGIVTVLLTGCANSDISIKETVKETVCSMHQEMVDAFTFKHEKQPICSGSLVKGCQPVIYFDVNSAELTDDSIQNLDWVVKKMAHYDRYNVSLTGHADISGDEADNLDLSEKRVLAVKNYLFDNGIDDARIKIDFKGAELPICEEEYCKELSRRVEVRLYSVNTDFSDLADFVTTNVFHNQKNEE